MGKTFGDKVRNGDYDHVRNFVARDMLSNHKSKRFNNDRGKRRSKDARNNFWENEENHNGD